MNWTQELKGVKSRIEKNNKNKYYYDINITIGFIVGIIIDNVIIGTCGIPIKLLKNIGPTLYKTEIKNKLSYKILNIPFIGAYFKGFLN